MKIGDKVKVIKVGLFVDEKTLGNVGIINSVIKINSVNKTIVYRVVFDNNSFWYYNEDQLQKDSQREEKLRRILK